MRVISHRGVAVLSMSLLPSFLSCEISGTDAEVSVEDKTDIVTQHYSITEYDNGPLSDLPAFNTVHPSDFVPKNAETRWYTGQSVLYRSSAGQTTEMFAHFLLADNNEVDSMECDMYDYYGDGSMTVTLYRKTQTSAVSCGSFTTSDSRAVLTYTVTNLCTSGTAYIVDNQPGSNYNTYLVKVETSSASSDLELFHCSVKKFN